uniref:BPTI/Kunitz inhibitor domain-containing protein n=1 Tax=Periophthalmus magnuspinnatus TaxID=409849 RepID=A0A3B3ZAN6_9GOBI
GLSLQYPAVCLLRAEEGPCRADIQRFYYNTLTQKCEHFSYGGCQGNANNFRTYLECHKTCFRIPSEFCWRFSDSHKWKQERDVLVHYTVLCHELSKRSLKNSCNTHNTLELMQYTQHFRTCVPMMCRLPQESGPCRAMLWRYFFNMSSLQCEPFYYGGCHGNANRFLSLASCSDLCSPTKGQSSVTSVLRPVYVYFTLFLHICICLCQARLSNL